PPAGPGGGGPGRDGYRTDAVGDGSTPGPPAGETDHTGPFKGTEVTLKAVVTRRPEPQFTESARKFNVTGLVKLRLVLGADGRVGNISIVKRLPHGLTENAVAAARGIGFRPAEKDGRAVSQYIVIEYNFNIY
ncbi:MAG TPA: energy transducer TonB, partial [Pyrinomonadaceae bacterium]|nr:energy transducer TonB [Pyrinomonadaceae bacterium]